jgi:hypothetical protein
VCHELGNLLAGVRLEAGLLEPDVAAAELDAAGQRIENASARAGSLLALVRPLLAPESVGLAVAAPSDVLAGLWSGLDANSDGRVQIDLESAADLPPVRLAPEVLHHLLLSAIFCGLEAGGRGSRVRVAAAPDGDGVAFAVVDEVREAAGETRALCGQPLVFAIAERLLQQAAGRFESTLGEDGTRSAFSFPEAPV